MIGTQTSGLASTSVDIADLSLLLNTGLKGIVGVAGITERGEWGKSRLVGSTEEYKEYFGGLGNVASNYFPLLCYRALGAGSKLLINPVGHYEDITDATSATGTRATAVVTGGGFNATLEADSPGIWANAKLWFSVAASSNGFADKFDVTVGLDGYPSLTRTVANVDKTLTPDSKAMINSLIKAGKFTTLTGTLVVTARTNAAAGAYDPTTVEDADYIGDADALTGLHAFDGSPEIVKVACPGVAIPAIDTALAAYADMRKDLMAVIRTPIGLTGAAVVDYRERTGSFAATGVPIDSWRTIMTQGGLIAPHPVTSTPLEISEIGDVLGAMSRRDNKYKEWFSFAGAERGKIGNVLGVIYNVGTAARKTTADNIDAHGIISVIKHESFGPVIWGNSTLHRADTLLKHANVAELMIFLTRALKPLVEVESFNPNDVVTWKAIYRRVSALMQLVKDGRGIWDYKYDGDQNVDDIKDAVVNRSGPGGNIDAGSYIFNLFISPKVGLKYTGIRVAVTNSGVNFAELSDQI